MDQVSIISGVVGQDFWRGHPSCVLSPQTIKFMLYQLTVWNDCWVERLMDDLAIDCMGRRLDERMTVWCRDWQSGASIPPEPMKHFPLFRKKLVSESQRKLFLTRFPGTIFHFVRQNLWWPFLVIDHYFRIFASPTVNYFIFTLLVSPFLSPISPCSSTFLPISQMFLLYIFFPP